MIFTASVVLVLSAALSASAGDFITGIDIGPDYEARVRSGIERNRKSPAAIEVVTKKGSKVVGASLSIRQTTSDFLFGCAFPAWPAPPERLGDQGWKNWNIYFTRLFNYATTENSFKWGFSERERGKPKWESGDFIVKWCNEHNIELKGHNLVWGLDSHGTPDWVYEHAPEEIGRLFRERIGQVMNRYKRDVRIWDVVNEPTHLHRLETAWSPDYVLHSFRWAREMDPSATLLINEFACFSGASDKYVALINRLLAQSAPIDAIGEQAHDTPLWHSPKDVFDNLDKLASTGLRIHLTELTYPSNESTITGGFVRGKWSEQKQAEFYRYLLTLAFSHPNVDAITLWAFWDGSTWLKQGGIIREDWTPKPAYNVVDDLINNRWKTRFEARSDTNGEVRFHGFHGSYEIIATSPTGKTAKATMHLVKGSKRHVRIVLD